MPYALCPMGRGGVPYVLCLMLYAPCQMGGKKLVKRAMELRRWQKQQQQQQHDEIQWRMKAQEEHEFKIRESEGPTPQSRGRGSVGNG